MRDRGCVFQCLETFGVEDGPEFAMDLASEDGVIGRALVDPLETFEEREGNVGEFVLALE